MAVCIFLKCPGKPSEARGEVSAMLRPSPSSRPKDKIRDVIGSGGMSFAKFARNRAKVDIEDDGSITVAHTDGAKGKQAVDWIKSIVAEPELNHIYDGKVVKAVDFGAF